MLILGLGSESLSEILDFFVFQFVFGHVGYLDDGSGILDNARYLVEGLLDLLEALSLHQGWLHHVEHGQRDPEENLGTFQEEEVPYFGNDMIGEVVREQTAYPLESYAARIVKLLLKMAVEVWHPLFNEGFENIVVDEDSDQLCIVVQRYEALEEHGQHPECFFLGHDLEEAANDEVESLAVAYFWIAD